MANNNFTGVVESVKKNDAGYWSVKCADGSWFGFGKTKPVFEEGDEVAFDYSKNGKYNNADPDTVEVISSGNEVKPKAKPAWSGKKQSGDSGKEGYWEAKEARDVNIQKEIRYQAARNAAIEVLSVALANKVIEVPEPSKKGSSRMEVLLTYVDKITDRFNKAVEAISSPEKEAVKAVAAAKVVKEVVEEEETTDENFR